MTVLLLADGWPVHTDDPVLSPEELLAVAGAQTLAQQCVQRCETVLQAAQARVRSEIDAGLQRGLAEGAARCAAQLFAHEQAQQQHWQRLERDTLSMVLVVLERIAPALGRGEVVRSLVRQAVSEARQARRLLVKVHPDCVDAVQSDLGSLRSSCAWLESLEVVGMPELGADDCVLESPNGFVNAGWATQMAAIREVLSGAVHVPEPAP